MNAQLNTMAPPVPCYELPDYGIRVTKIGRVGSVGDSVDEYLLVDLLDDDMPNNAVSDALLPVYFDHGSSRAGSYFCTRMSVLPTRSRSQKIAIVHHRWDV